MYYENLIERLLAYRVKTDDAEWSPRICVEAAKAMDILMERLEALEDGKSD